MSIRLTDLGLICSLGDDYDTIVHNSLSGFSPGLHNNNEDIPGETVPFFSAPVTTKHDMRCYDLLDVALSQIMTSITKLKNKYDSKDLGIVLGTSNTGVHEAQNNINLWIKNNTCPNGFSFDQIELGSPAIYLKNKLNISGPSYVISTACSSSAKAFESARNLINNHICKAVIVGGVDSRCMFAQNGFHSLGALSKDETVPFSINRSGINLGEGAALFIMEDCNHGIELFGIGESTDAYDLTHPDPTGLGAYTAMKRALDDAHLSCDKIDYINMHGTGTEANDDMEGNAIFNLFGNNTLCASTKSLTGHTLGASGAIELALSWLMIKKQFIIPHKFDGNFDKKIPNIKLATNKDEKKLSYILSNSFAFGGSNVSVIIGGQSENN